MRLFLYMSPISHLKKFSNVYLPKFVLIYHAQLINIRYGFRPFSFFSAQVYGTLLIFWRSGFGPRDQSDVTLRKNLHLTRKSFPKTSWKLPQNQIKTLNIQKNLKGFFIVVSRNFFRGCKKILRGKPPQKCPPNQQKVTQINKKSPKR